MTPAAAIYCRVSTGGQDPDNQLRVLQEWARARGFEVVQIYSETESAWRDGHQAELARVRAAGVRLGSPPRVKDKRRRRRRLLTPPTVLEHRIRLTHNVLGKNAESAASCRSQERRGS